MLYAQDHGGQYPDSLVTVLRDEDVTPEVFVSPGSKDTPAAGPTTQAVLDNLTAGGHLSYVYLGRGLSGEPPANTVVAYEAPGIWPGGANVLFADEHVEFVETPLLNQIIAKAATGGFPVTMPSE